MAATLKVAASGATHEHLSPKGGRAKRVVRMGRSGGCERCRLSAVQAEQALGYVHIAKAHCINNEGEVTWAHCWNNEV